MWNSYLWLKWHCRSRALTEWNRNHSRLRWKEKENHRAEADAVSHTQIASQRCSLQGTNGLKLRWDRLLKVKALQETILRWGVYLSKPRAEIKNTSASGASTYSGSFTLHHIRYLNVSLSFTVSDDLFNPHRRTSQNPSHASELSASVKCWPLLLSVTS